MTEPSLIQFEQFGKPEEGFLSVAQYQQHIPFEIKRIFWVYEVPDFAERGNHAYFHTEQVLIALHGALRINVEGSRPEKSRLTRPDLSRPDLSRPDRKAQFELHHPSQGLYLPARCWRKVQFLDHAVMLLLSSREYDESDYIREYAFFKTLKD